MTDYQQAAANLRGYLTYLSVHGMNTKDVIEAADLLVQAAADRERLDKIRAATKLDVRPEQCADYVLSRAGFSEREIDIATKVAVEATNQERTRVRVILGDPHE